MITHIEVATVTWPVPVLIGVMILVFFVGALIGYFNSNIDAKKKLEEARSRAEVAASQARAEIERAATRIAHAEKMAASASAQSLPGNTLLRLWLDSAERLSLNLDGQNVDTTQISDLHRKRLSKLVRLMEPWLEGEVAAPVETIQSVPAARASQPVPASVKTAAKKEEAAVAPTSIVSQINEILQARLASNPQETREIRLEESHEGGVTVWVGKKKFAGVGEVTDPEVQSILRAAIAEWEKKYTPGL